MKYSKILFKPRPGTSRNTINKFVRELDGEEIGRIPQLNVIEIRVPEKAVTAVVKALSKRRDIQYVEVDTLEKLLIRPNDPLYAYSWYLKRVQAEGAWNMASGSGQVVAVLDTGIQRDHPDFVGKIVGGWNSEDLSSNYDAVNPHGTMVAGVIGSVPNNGVGITPLGWNTKVAMVRVTNDPEGWAYISALARGVLWAADNGYKIVNMSYRGWSHPTVDDAAKYLRNRGGILVGSAGNSGHDYGDNGTPNTIVVSATNDSDKFAHWSSFGMSVDICAPGEDILTTTINSGYAYVNGTSFSAPLVAAVIALMWSVNKDLSIDDVERILLSSTDKLSPEGWSPYYGWGRLNAKKAVMMSLDYEKRPAPPLKFTVKEKEDETTQSQIFMAGTA
jgi:thermitase